MKNNAVENNHSEMYLENNILQDKGPASGKINGINHLVMFTHDMNAGVNFYRDILGMRVVRTQQFITTGEGLRTAARHSSGAAVGNTFTTDVDVQIKLKQVFFEMGNGELFSLYEAPVVSDKPDAPVSSVLWPNEIKSNWSKPTKPQKVDHLSFDVLSHEDVIWFRKHLIDNGVSVSDVSERKGVNNTHRFISSIYFSDPSGNPLEISSFDVSDESWLSYDFSDWFMDKEPVSALLNKNDYVEETLKPRWLKMPSLQKDIHQKSDDYLLNVIRILEDKINRLQDDNDMLRKTLIYFAEKKSRE